MAPTVASGIVKSSAGLGRLATGKLLHLFAAAAAKLPQHRDAFVAAILILSVNRLATIRAPHSSRTPSKSPPATAIPRHSASNSMTCWYPLASPCPARQNGRPRAKGGTLPLHPMSQLEKLSAMEALWAELSRDEQALESPGWHADALRETKRRVSAGEEKPLDWEAAKKELRVRFD